MTSSSTATEHASDSAPFLYARVDVLRSTDGVGAGDGLLLSEMEILDPELFFRVNKDAATKMAAAIVHAVKRVTE